MGATNYIHIGRNKCASTTLQYFFLNNLEALAREGVDYFLYGGMVDSFPSSPGLRDHNAYAAHIAAHPDRATLISSEDMMGPFHAGFAGPLAGALKGAPRKIIAYIRDYSSWLRSSYMEAVMTGRTTVDIDVYTRQTESVSAMFVLEHWAEHVGWDNMYVRSLDHSCLYRGDVVSDCAKLLGLSAGLVEQRRPPAKHVSPHWICVEIIRFLRATRSQSDWRTFTHEVIYELRPLIEQAIAESGASDLPGQYLTSAQSADLQATYDRDTAALSVRMGVEIPGARAPSKMERPFLPSIDAVPLETLRALMRIARETFAGRTDAPAFIALRTSLPWVHTA